VAEAVELLQWSSELVKLRQDSSSIFQNQSVERQKWERYLKETAGEHP